MAELKFGPTTASPRPMDPKSYLINARSKIREGRFEHGPLDVGEVHAVEYDGHPTDVSC